MAAVSMAKGCMQTLYCGEIIELERNVSVIIVGIIFYF